jgi:uncharacterized protein affecting Mg2+/Co2+ transport
MSLLATSSSAETSGVLVEVQSFYLEEQSHPASRRFVFAYTITITNNGSEVVQLKTRHWIITDGLGDVDEVKGPGVVGEQPVLSPGESFRYTTVPSRAALLAELVVTVPGGLDRLVGLDSAFAEVEGAFADEVLVDVLWVGLPALWDLELHVHGNAPEEALLFHRPKRFGC